jgi:hypothetical protein
MEFNSCLPLKFLAVVSDEDSKEPLKQTLSS